MNKITPEARVRCLSAHTLRDQLEYHRDKIAYHLEQRRKLEFALRLQEGYNVMVRDDDQSDIHLMFKADSGV